MESVIIGIPGKATSEKIAGIIRRRSPDIEVCIGTTASYVLQEANDREHGIVICADRISDMNYAELFEYLPGGFEMIVISKQTSVETAYEKIKILPMPVRAGDLLELVTERLDYIGKTKRKKKHVRITRTPEEQEVIDKAKQLLMNKHNITEPDAYRMLQKQSMDYSRSLVESAQMILLLNSEW